MLSEVYKYVVQSSGISQYAVFHLLFHFPICEHVGVREGWESEDTLVCIFIAPFRRRLNDVACMVARYKR